MANLRAREKAKTDKEDRMMEAKAEKARKVARKVGEKTLKKEHATTMNLAMKTIGKLQPIILEMKGMLIDSATMKQKTCLSEIPSEVTKEAMSICAKVQCLYMECMQRLSDASVVLLFVLPDVADVAEKANESLQSLRKFDCILNK